MLSTLLHSYPSLYLVNLSVNVSVLELLLKDLLLTVPLALFVTSIDITKDVVVIASNPFAVGGLIETLAKLTTPPETLLFLSPTINVDVLISVFTTPLPDLVAKSSVIL